jgi:uncharacterized protein DUF6789
MEQIMLRANYLKGMVGGLAGTIALSTFLVMKDMMGIMPEFDMMTMLATMLGGSRATAWIVHFFIGTGMWGVPLLGSIHTCQAVPTGSGESCSESVPGC